MGGFYSMVSFSRGEVRDLLISMVVLSFAFAFFLEMILRVIYWFWFQQ